MDVPDFSKYDETQLRQILTRIDRERFSERVIEIEARLSALKRNDSPAGSKNPTAKSLDGAKFFVMPLPEGPKKVFGPALPFFAIAAISIILAVIADSTDRHAMLAIAGPIGIVAMFIAFAVVFFDSLRLLVRTAKMNVRQKS